MKFRKEVEEQFKKAGWYEGRNLQKKYDKINKFNELPNFLKEFLYEYGDLLVETSHPKNIFLGTLNLKVVSRKKLKIKTYLEKPSLKGNVFTFPIGYYQNPNDGGTIECDKEGTIYIMGEYPLILSDNFKEGIEKIIMENYLDTLEWNPFHETWDERFFQLINYTLTNNLGEEKECTSIENLRSFLNKPYTYWQEGTGDSAIYTCEKERIIFFKLKEGIFIMQHPDYLAPIISKTVAESVIHYIGGQEISIPKKCLCSKKVAFQILSNYINKGILSNTYEWRDMYEL